MNGIKNISKQKKTAIVFNIQRHSLHDGPGIRTTVFLKGCTLACKWCCNPESIKPQVEVGFEKTKCIQCGKCVQVCKYNAINPDYKDNTGYKIDSKKCTVCGDCIKICPTSALSYIGKEMTIEELFKEIENDTPFYRPSDGGVTFSGGEPLQNINFLEEILKKCHQNNITTAIETCGNIPWKNFGKIIDYTDYYLFDIKHLDPDEHKKLTGLDNKLILENLKKLSKKTDNIILRIPLIPGYNDDENNIKKIGELAVNLNIKEVNILPYHRLGIGKYKIMNKQYMFENLGDMSTTTKGRKKIDECRDMLQEMNLNVTIGG